MNLIKIDKGQSNLAKRRRRSAILSISSVKSCYVMSWPPSSKRN